jgi:hypothetical protein
MLVLVVDEGLRTLCRQQRANLRCVTTTHGLAKLLPRIPRNGSDPITDEGQILLEILLDDPDLLKDRRTLHWECQCFQEERVDYYDDDVTFLLHHKGAISATFTGD